MIVLTFDEGNQHVLIRLLAREVRVRKSFKDQRKQISPCGNMPGA